MLAVGKCYAACNAQADQRGAEFRRDVLDFTWTLIVDGEQYYVSEETYAHGFNMFLNALCEELVAGQELMEHCWHGCYDVERVYDVTRSFARGTFRQRLLVGRETLGALGLWVDATRVIGEDFKTACDNLQSRAEVPPIRSLPKP